jgi:hypothetical protein
MDRRESWERIAAIIPVTVEHAVNRFVLDDGIPNPRGATLVSERIKEKVRSQLRPPFWWVCNQTPNHRRLRNFIEVGDHHKIIWLWVLLIDTVDQMIPRPFFSFPWTSSEESEIERQRKQLPKEHSNFSFVWEVGK